MLLLYINRKNKICKLIFYAIQVMLLAFSIVVAFLLKGTEDRSLTDYFFHVEYSMLNILPVTRSAGFIIGYNLGIVFYHFKKEPEKENFWLIKKLQKKVFRVALPLVGLLGFVIITYLFYSFLDI